MNFLHVSKRHPPNDVVLSAIQTQAKAELGRMLTSKEEANIFCKMSPETLNKDINLVILLTLCCNTNFLFQYGDGYLTFNTFLSQRMELSCEASLTPIPRDGNCLIHGKVEGWKFK